MKTIGKPLINSLAKEAIKLEFGMVDDICFIPTAKDIEYIETVRELDPDLIFILKSVWIWGFSDKYLQILN